MHLQKLKTSQGSAGALHQGRGIRWPGHTHWHLWKPMSLGCPRAECVSAEWVQTSQQDQPVSWGGQGELESGQRGWVVTYYSRAFSVSCELSSLSICTIKIAQGT